jgi:DNA-binding MarR family transcriptional regulator
VTARQPIVRLPHVQPSADPAPLDPALFDQALLDEALLLDSQLCFLVYRLHRALNERYRPVLADLGLTYPQYLVMLVLWEEAEPMTVGELGRRLHLDSGTLSPLLKRMEGAGLVSRSRSAEDERSVRISLTAAGVNLRSRATNVPLWIGSCIADTAADASRVRSTLAEVLERVEGAESVAAG